MQPGVCQDEQENKYCIRPCRKSHYSTQFHLSIRKKLACNRGGEWKLVRGAPYKPLAGQQKWHSSINSFDGTDEYGDIDTPENHFSIRFDTIQFEEVKN